MKDLFRKLSVTDNNYGSIFLRISFVIMMFPHATGKLFGIFGGFGFEKSMHHLTENMGIPYILALVAMLIEFLSSLMILVGYQTRINAFLLASVMTVAGFMHSGNGFLYELVWTKSR